MGGDYAPKNEIEGALQAAAQMQPLVEVILVGREDAVKASVGSALLPGVHLYHAPDVVGMADEPSTIIKQRKESSLFVGLELMRTGRADAFVSAGNTGAVMATATMMCGRLPGVSRPTIGSFFPTQRDRPTLVVDVGANVDSKARFLHDYAVMGSVYCELMQGISNPTVALLNVGEEPSKGTDVVREAYELLQQAPVNFIGNVEGRDILRGTADVIVCDGFEGNIVLKFAESVLGFLRERFRSYANRSWMHRMSMGLFRPLLKGALTGLDYQEYGGVPLLGINGVVIIGHGSSSPAAITNMIVRAVEVVQRDVNGHIKRKLEPLTSKGTSA